MPKLQLVYFSVRARDQAVRMCLAYGKIPYEDLSISQYFGGKAWPEAKPLCSYDQVPLLVVDGKPLAQSGAITRFAAGLAGLVPADPYAAAKADEVFEAAQELAPVNPIVNVFRGETHEDKKAEFFSTFPRKLENLAAQLAITPGPFFGGEVPHYGDFAVYHQLDLARLLDGACLDACPSVPPFMDAVAALPGVAEFLATRPECVGVGTAPMLKARAPASSSSI